MEGKKVLIIAHKPPYPKVDGGCIAIAQLLEAYLSIGISVHFIAMETAKHPGKNNLQHPNLHYKTVRVNTSVNLIGALKNLFSKSSYFLSRFAQKSIEDELIKTLDKHTFETVIFESLFTCSYIDIVRKNSKAKLVYRSHNIEHKIWETQNSSETNTIRKGYLNIQIRRLKKEELSLWNAVDMIASIAKTDSIKMAQKSSTEIKNIGLYCNKTYLNASDESTKIDFFHIGAMDWKPNLTAIIWLLNNVWKEFRSNNTKAELHLAGRKMPSELIFNQDKGVHNHKEVSDSLNFMSSHKVMLVPLFSGSGIRVKIIEGLALGKCIITTNIGAAGIAITPNKNILIANTKEEFIAKMEFCINKPDKVKEIGEKARQFARENFSEENIHQQLKDLL